MQVTPLLHYLWRFPLLRPVCSCYWRWRWSWLHKPTPPIKISRGAELEIRKRAARLAAQQLLVPSQFTKARRAQLEEIVGALDVEPLPPDRQQALLRIFPDGYHWMVG